jgi:hypothetical protein
MTLPESIKERVLTMGAEARSLGTTGALIGTLALGLGYVEPRQIAVGSTPRKSEFEFYAKQRFRPSVSIVPDNFLEERRNESGQKRNGLTMRESY